MANKYSEELFGAIDEILRVRLQSLNKDTTILCNIVDNKEAADGKYTVSNSGLRFTAYSDKTNYENEDSVWVLVPDGNYENTKLIIGKYVTANSEAFNYVNPFASFIQITPNLCSNIHDQELGLTANEIDTGNNALARAIPYNNGESIIDENIDLSSFNGLGRIGVFAQFKTTFPKSNPLPPVTGDYGLNFEIMTDLGKTLNFSLSTSDGLSGNLYGLGFYYSGRKVYDFDPEKDGNIRSIKCTFFQAANFYNGDRAYPWKTQKTRPNGTTYDEVYDHNIFVKNLQIMLGFSTSQIKGTTAFLRTADSLLFDFVSGDSKNYTKTMYPRLVYKIGANAYRYINTLKDFQKLNREINELEDTAPLKQYPKVKFYNYDPTSGYVDPRAGEGWLEIQQTDEEVQNFQITRQLQNKQQELFKTIFVFKNKNKYTVLNRLDVLAKKLNTFYNEDDEAAVQLIIDKANSYTIEKIYNKMGRTLPTEETHIIDALWTYIEWISTNHRTAGGVAAYLIENDIYEKYSYSSVSKEDNFEKSKFLLEILYTSENLVFTNAVSSESAITDLIQGLRLNAVDDKKGIYNIYKATENANSELIRTSDTYVKRNIEASFVSSANQTEELNTADRIYWLVPKTISMINTPVNGVGFGKYYNTITITKQEFEELRGGNAANGDMILYKYNNGTPQPVASNEEYAADINYYIENISYLFTDDDSTGDYIKPFSELLSNDKISILEKNFLQNNINNFYIILEDRTAYSSKRAKKAAFMYQIKPIYRKSLTNNRVYCAVYKGEQLYTASLELYFGVKGVNDSGYTLTITPHLVTSRDPNTSGGVTNVSVPGLNEVPGVWEYGWTQSYDLRATVYNSNDEIDNNFTFTWDWEKRWEGFNFSDNSNTNIKSIQPVENRQTLDGYIGGIVKCTATRDNNDIIITQYYILPIRVGSLIDHVDGINTIIYDNNNINPKYYNIPYAAKTSDDKNINISSIDLITVSGADTKYIPTLVRTGDSANNATLVPTATYVNDANYNFYIKITTDSNNTWYQPVLITLNNYSNSAIKAISTTQQIKTSEDGSTISSVMSSITNNNLNQITGIIIGSLPMTSNNTKRTGILGYKNDTEVFGFFDNGTGFIDGTAVQLPKRSIADIYWNGGTSTFTSANTVFAGPTSGNANTPSFRALTDADIPNTLTLEKIKIGNTTYTISTKVIDGDRILILS